MRRDKAEVRDLCKQVLENYPLHLLNYQKEFILEAGVAWLIKDLVVNEYDLLFHDLTEIVGVRLVCDKYNKMNKMDREYKLFKEEEAKESYNFCANNPKCRPDFAFELLLRNRKSEFITLESKSHFPKARKHHKTLESFKRIQKCQAKDLKMEISKEAAETA